ncbi:MAG: cupredoxin domain-containing protein [candidate division WOR-3 bacterium]
MTNEAPNYLGGAKKKKIIVAVSLLVLFVLGIGIFLCRTKKLVRVSMPIGPGAPTSTLTEISEEKKAEKIITPLGQFDVENPEQTAPLEPAKIEEVAAKGAIHLTISSTGFSPSSFTVEAGQNVSLILQAVDGTHTFNFEAPELADIYMGVALGETRGLSFIAPAKRGDYYFFCRESGHKERGEKGVMHVK